MHVYECMGSVELMIMFIKLLAPTLLLKQTDRLSPADCHAVELIHRIFRISI